MPKIEVEMSERLIESVAREGVVGSDPKNHLQRACQAWIKARPIKLEIEVTASEARVIADQYPSPRIGGGIAMGVLTQIADKLRERGHV